MSFAVTLGILVTVFLLSELLRPRPKIDDHPVPAGRKPRTERIKTGLFTSIEVVTGYEGDGLGDFQFPTDPPPPGTPLHSEELVAGPNVVWFDGAPANDFLDVPDPHNPYRR